MNPIISVIIPVYNVEKYIKGCIDSLIEQSFEEIEFIFVDDNSPDDSKSIIRNEMRMHPDKIRLIELKENKKQGGARNIGIDHSRGELIGFVDPDDYVSPSMFDELYRSLMSANADAAFIQYTSVPEQSDLKAECHSNSKPIIVWKEEIEREQGENLNQQGVQNLIAYSMGGVWCGLYKKELIIENNIRFPEGLRYEDNYWLTLISSYIRKYGLVHQIGYYYRQNPYSTVNSKNQIYIKDRIIIERELIKAAKDRGIFEKYRKAWEFLYTIRYAFGTYYLYISRFDKVSSAFLRELMDDLRHEFPGWASNSFYLSNVSKKRRLLNRLIYHAPRICGKIGSVVYRMLKTKK